MDSNDRCTQCLARSKNVEHYLLRCEPPSKSPKTYEELISILKDRGLSFDGITEENAISLLKECLYYRFTAYRFPFVYPGNHDQFLPDAQFINIWSLYAFDRRLRLAVLDAVERIEISLRSRWAHVLALRHGALAYENKNIHTEKFHEKLLLGIHEAIIDSKEPCITHFKDNAKHPQRIPIWSVCEILTQGQLFSAINYLKNENLRKQIFAGMGIDSKRMSSFLNVIRNVRNICAHHGRLWNKKLFFEMKIPKEPKELNKSLIAGEKSVYNVLTILIFLMRNIAPQSGWETRIRHLIELTEDFIRKGMGFPENWRERPIWQNQKPTKLHADSADFRGCK